MNLVNTSTSFSPFQLYLGHSPYLIPALVDHTDGDGEEFNTYGFLKCLCHNMLEAQDNLCTAKVSLVVATNWHHSPDPLFQEGELVLLSTKSHYHDYLSCDNGCVTKFMPHFNRLYCVICADHASSYALEMPVCSYVSPAFHVSQLHPFLTNNDSLFPSCMVAQLEPILTLDSKLKHHIDHILEEWCVGWAWQYLVQ